MYPQWTAAEDKIVREKTPKDALKLLPHRSPGAILTRRRNLNASPPASPRWSKRELNILRKHAKSSPAELAKRLPGRSAIAIKSQKTLFGLGRGQNHVSWRTTELSRLKQMAPNASTAELLAAFPDHNWVSIRRMAFKLTGKMRLAQGHCANDLLQEVRQRCIDDRVAIGALTAQLDLPNYFLHSRRTEKIDMNRLARVVEFFGGRLRIDWQDE